jgi:hypothetical protein
VTRELFPPPARDMPPGRLAARRRFLVEEVSGPYHSRRVRRHWQAAAATLVILLAIAAPTLALSASVREFVGIGSPDRVRILLLNVAAPTPDGEMVGLSVAPSPADRECWLVGAGRARRLPPPTPPSASLLGADVFIGRDACVALGGTLHARHSSAPLEVEARYDCRPSAGRDRGPKTPCLYGRLAPWLGAEHVELQWTGGAQRLSLEGEYFIGGAPILDEASPQDRPLFVAAYDGSGREVARQQLAPDDIA